MLSFHSQSKDNGQKIERRAFLHLLACAGAMALVPRCAIAQDYPRRAITMINPFPAGGPLDTIGRILADRMREQLGQPVVVENVTGAGGNIGTGRVARAAPDGYTLGLGYWGTHVANAATYALEYDVVKDFEPIAQLASNPLVLVSRKGIPASNLKELITWLRDHGPATLGTSGAGTAGHLMGLLLEKETGVRLQFVPYRGVTPTMQDLIGGQIDLAFTTSDVFIPQWQAQNVSAYAVTGKDRLHQAPEIPTVREAGLPQLQFSQWYALWAPRGTPSEIIHRLGSSIVIALAEPAVRKRLIELGMDIPSRDEQTPEALAVLQRDEINRWWPLIKAAGVKGE